MSLSGVRHHDNDSDKPGYGPITSEHSMERALSQRIKRICAIGALIALCAAIAPLFTQRSSKVVRMLVVREKPVPSDAIIVMLGGAAQERIELAVNLFRQGMAPKIIFCDGYEIGGWKSWWYHKRGWIPFGKNYRLFLHRAGIPDNAIEMAHCPGIEDTADEMTVLSQLLRMQRRQRVLVVTSASHSRRASLIWKRVAPQLTGIMVAARDPGLAWWWSTRHGRTTISYEYLALAKEVLRSLFG